MIINYPTFQKTRIYSVKCFNFKFIVTFSFILYSYKETKHWHWEPKSSKKTSVSSLWCKHCGSTYCLRWALVYWLPRVHFSQDAVVFSVLPVCCCYHHPILYLSSLIFFFVFLFFFYGSVHRSGHACVSKKDMRPSYWMIKKHL